MGLLYAELRMSRQGGVAAQKETPRGQSRASELTRDPNLVELSEFLIVAFSRNIIPQADGAQGNKTKVKGFQEVPVVLQDGEHGRRDEKEAGHGDKAEEHGVDDGHQLLGEAPADVEVEDRPACDMDGDALDHGREEQEGEGNADDRVDNAEGLPAIRQGHRVAVTCGEKGGEEDTFQWHRHAAHAFPSAWKKSQIASLTPQRLVVTVTAAHPTEDAIPVGSQPSG